MKAVQKLTIALAGICVTVSATATELPKYDPPAYCDQVSQAVGGSVRVKNRCIDQEQKSYNALKTDWASVEPRTQQHCSQVSEVIGGSYHMLGRCIASETKEASKPSQFKF